MTTEKSPCANDLFSRTSGAKRHHLDCHCQRKRDPATPWQREREPPAAGSCQAYRQQDTVYFHLRLRLGQQDGLAGPGERPVSPTAWRIPQRRLSLTPPSSCPCTPSRPPRCPDGVYPGYPDQPQHEWCGCIPPSTPSQWDCTTSNGPPTTTTGPAASKTTA